MLVSPCLVRQMSSEPLTEDCGRDQRHWDRRRPSQIISVSAMYTYFAWPETHKVLVFCEMKALDHDWSPDIEWFPISVLKVLLFLFHPLEH